MSFLRIIAALAFAVIATQFIACSKTGTANSSANATNTTSMNVNRVSTPGASPTSSEPKTESGNIGSLATPTEAYKTAYDCRKRKDIECLKKVMTQDIQDFLKMMGEDDKKSLDDMLKDMCERPQAATNESRNEKITGDTATLEYPDEKGTWHTMDFEKVNGEWKMGAPKGPKSPDSGPKKP